MTRTYYFSPLDTFLKRFTCCVYENDSPDLCFEVSAVFSGVILVSLNCQNIGLPSHFASVEISTFLSRCQSFLTGKQECFDFESSERF